MKFKSHVTAFAVLACFSLPQPGFAQDADRTAALLADLAQADEADARRLEKEIRLEWSKSGSAAMDLLLKRGRDALEVNKVEAAIEHFTALTDHAPDFAEGWHGLAQAYFHADMYGPTADALERTLALNPHHFGAMRGLGAIFEALDKPALAYDAYSRVLELRPHDPDVTEALDRLDLAVKGTTL
ncbi:tetratricopeptide repeat protein [Thalassococcus sp. BH17M4-6]|uniref:tetratricopeptide repeat protein n=1 Tax=Thalassococcus sp. BH17M4-6 TaxID=3413148 RepID=UPI003BE2A6D2